MQAKAIKTYKLFNRRCDGTLGPLFINRKQRVPVGKWLKAKAVPTDGFAFRPGWHATLKPVAPHLSKKGRVWAQVSLRGAVELRVSKSHGGTWLLAKELKVEKVLECI